MEQPEGEIFIIPARLEECENLESLRKWHWVDLFEVDGYHKLIWALRARADRIGATLRIRRSGQSISSRPKSKESEETTESPVSGVGISGSVIGTETRSTPEQEKTESDAIEKAAREKAARETAEKAEREKAEKAARDKLEREAAERAKLEKAEREAAERTAQEKAKRDATEKAKREKAERRAAQIVVLKEALSKSLNTLKLAIPKAIPFLRIGGIIGTIFILFWVGSWAMPQFMSLIPTAKASVTPLPTSTIALSSSPIVFTKTVTPSATQTKPTTPNPTALQTEITDSKGVQMVLVSEGNFIMGNDTGAQNEKPANEVYINSFYIDKHEITNKLYKDCVNAGACQPPKQSYLEGPVYSKDSVNQSSSGKFIVMNYFDSTKYENFPVVFVDWSMAKTYCEWRDAHLPTEAEWEKASRGRNGQVYPWGNDFDCHMGNFF